MTASQFPAKPLVDRLAINAETLMHGVVPARPLRQLACVLTDAGIVAAVVGLTWPYAWIGVTLAALICIALMVTAIHRTGQSAGHRLFGVRVIDPKTSLPGSWKALASASCAGTDIRNGRDPLRVQPRHLGMIPQTTIWSQGHEQRGSKVYILQADDGLRWPIQGPTLIGRNASDTSGRFAMISVPDMSKTVSRNHILLEPGPNGLKVTDLGSSNGTAILRSDKTFLVRKHEPGTVQPGSHLLLGTRLFEVHYE